MHVKLEHLERRKKVVRFLVGHDVMILATVIRDEQRTQHDAAMQASVLWWDCLLRPSHKMQHMLPGSWGLQPLAC